MQPYGPSHKHNVEQKKLDTEELIQCASIYIKFKNRKKTTHDVKTQDWVVFVGANGDWWGQEDLVGGGNTCFFNIGASYIDVFTL